MVMVCPVVFVLLSPRTLVSPLFPYTTLFRSPEIVNCLKFAKLLVVLSVPLVGVMISPAVPKVWLQRASAHTSTHHLPLTPVWRMLLNDHAPVVASVSVVASCVSSPASTTPGL